MNLPALLATHQYQYDGSHRNRNECALCAMAMVITQAAQISGNPDFRLPASELGRWLDRIPFRYPRFPAWFPGPGGATHPLAALWGLRDYARKLRRDGINFPWEPRVRTRQTMHSLAEIIADSPALIYGVGDTGVPHVVVPTGRSGASWQILDPGAPTEKNPLIWSDDQLQKWWRNYSVLYPRGTMISLEPIAAPEEKQSAPAR